MAGCAGLLLSMGVARAQTGTEEATSDEPVCKDAGVTVSFATASTTLDKNARGALTGLATWMKGKDERTVKLQGYADPTRQRGVQSAAERKARRRGQELPDGPGYRPGARVDQTRLATTQDRPPTAEGRKVTVTACDEPVKTAVVKPVEEAGTAAAGSRGTRTGSAGDGRGAASGAAADAAAAGQAAGPAVEDRHRGRNWRGRHRLHRTPARVASPTRVRPGTRE